MAWSRAEAAAAESNKEASEATTALDMALADAASAEECCNKAEAGLKALREEQDAHGQLLQQREEDIKAHEATLTDRSLRSICGGGYEELLATPEDGFVRLLPKLVKALEDVAAGVDSWVEGECRSLFTAAATHVFSHLHLRDPGFDLSAPIELVALESRTTAAEAMKEQVNALLGKFLCVSDPEAVREEASGSEDGGSIIDDGLPKASGSGGQGDGGPSS
nr:uncharacterized protein LOC109731853 [Aegilops tauschii subsp. strangulata]